MFSTTTIASSTRMPIEKISANSDTRLSVKPQAHEANSVTVSVRITALPTIAASRRPSVRENEPDHGGGGEQELFDQLGGLVVCGRAVVARLGDFDAVRDQRIAAASRRAP
jgi:hypothetical protein